MDSRQVSSCESPGANVGLPVVFRHSRSVPPVDAPARTQTFAQGWQGSWRGGGSRSFLPHAKLERGFFGATTQARWYSATASSKSWRAPSSYEFRWREKFVKEYKEYKGCRIAINAA